MKTLNGMESMRIERWATPATIGTFAVTAITGVFMFFHLQTGWMKTAHEWVGWLAVAAAVFHTLVHWRAFKMHFANKLGLSVILVFLAAGLLSAIPSSSGKRPGNPARQVITAIEQASINAVSPVTGHTPELLTLALTEMDLRVLTRRGPSGKRRGGISFPRRES